jgi:hypothetical protein
MNNEQQALQNWLQKQIVQTKDEIKWCENHPHPVNEVEVFQLKYRLSYLESELDNLMYPID